LLIQRRHGYDIEYAYRQLVVLLGLAIHQDIALVENPLGLAGVVHQLEHIPYYHQ
jgi:hypothetical protein